MGSPPTPAGALQPTWGQIFSRAILAFRGVLMSRRPRRLRIGLACGASWTAIAAAQRWDASPVHRADRFAFAPSFLAACRLEEVTAAGDTPWPFFGAGGAVWKPATAFHAGPPT
jgi:hypothetical protein